MPNFHSAFIRTPLFDKNTRLYSFFSDRSQMEAGFNNGNLKVKTDPSTPEPFSNYVADALVMINSNTQLRLEEVKEENCDIQFVYEPERRLPRAYTFPKKDGKVVIAFGPCLADAAHAAHQILHGIGMAHEHSRYDRDLYLDVDPSKDPSGDCAGYYKVLGVSYDHYDISSLQHYPHHPHGILNQVDGTCVPSNKVLSKIDVETINFLYPKDIANVQEYQTSSRQEGRTFSKDDIQGLYAMSETQVLFSTSDRIFWCDTNSRNEENLLETISFPKSFDGRITSIWSASIPNTIIINTTVGAYEFSFVTLASKLIEKFEGSKRISAFPLENSWVNVVDQNLTYQVISRVSNVEPKRHLFSKKTQEEFVHAHTNGYLYYQKLGKIFKYNPLVHYKDFDGPFDELAFDFPSQNVKVIIENNVDVHDRHFYVISEGLWKFDTEGGINAFEKIVFENPEEASKWVPLVTKVSRVNNICHCMTTSEDDKRDYYVIDVSVSPAKWHQGGHF